MTKIAFRSSICLLLLVAALTHSSPAQAQSSVMLKSENGRFQLIRNGKPFPIKGVGGNTYLAELAAAGGNAIRTWDSKNLGPVLDEAHRHGLAVCAGLWMGHQRHGFDYQNQDAVLKQLDEKLDYVRKHKDHPALLMWAVGNEAEGEGKDPSVWYAIDHLAREIKRVDPGHPTMTVVAELGDNAAKIRSIERFCPHIDIIGINAYGGIESVGQRFKQAGGTKPYLITEHGPLGPWEVGKTPWGSPIEWSSTEKAAFYAKGFQANAVEQSERCLGTFAFLWGHKQETTATWFGMLLPDGRRLGAVDAMTKNWTGSYPANRCPQISGLSLDKSGNLQPGTVLHAEVSASDPEGDTLSYQWVLRSDAGTIGEGGDPQEAESAFDAAVVSQANRATITMPEGGGGYRLFVYVDDGHGGAAVANAPLNVAAPMALRSAKPTSPLPYVVYGDAAKESVYVPSGYMGNTAAVSMELDCKENPRSGSTCLKAEYKSGASWGGVLWQSPPEDWEGLKPGGANLTGATQLEFWARGAEGGEKVSFVFGVLDGNQPYRDTAKGELKDVVLTKEWNKMTIPLRGLDLRQIKTGFGWSLAGQSKPVTFYLDDIRYTRED